MRGESDTLYVISFEKGNCLKRRSLVALWSWGWFLSPIQRLPRSLFYIYNSQCCRFMYSISGNRCHLPHSFTASQTL